jgi:Protein of unknown function (DUF1203)
MTHFQVRALDSSHVRDAERRLAAGDPAVREHIVGEGGGAPCRLTLEDAPTGARVLLFRHRPFSGDHPYAEEGPIFARTGALQATLGRDEVPAMVARRPFITVRRYDAAEAIVGAEVVAGTDCKAAIERALAHDDTAFAHVRNSAWGCFLFRVDRA